MAYRFCENEQFDFEVRALLGAAWQKGSDPGEVLATAGALSDADGPRWFDAWTALARRVRADGERAAAAGRKVSARDAWLRAAGYFGAGLVAADALADEAVLLEVFREHRECFDRFAAAWEPAAERVTMPYEGTGLPGYLFRPAAGGTAAGGTAAGGTAAGGAAGSPTMIVNNGSDGPVGAAWTMLGAPAVARGWNALLFDGPGQQTMLFEHGMPFRPDWEHVITPVVDFLLARGDVDPQRLVLAGISQAGYWVPRALAFEHRIAAGVADPGVVDVAASWWRNFPPELRALFDAGEQEAFDAALREGLAQDAGFAAYWRWRAKPYRIDSPYDLLTEVGRYDLTAVLDRITVPLLVTSPEGEHFWPGQSRALYEALPGEKAFVEFTAAEGADLHCEPLGRALFEQRVFDWLDGRLADRPAG
ncbi:dipeptidyl aminopeptidase [Streptomyces venezuelae]|uniref:Dipeptidyl aminopeptidase n=1 Tax=Streptomyces venezuelae TaxID=54571 RepID=A0A5P2DAM6_STRVZ|nr:dipeptidyl aminopeptidase [Streptomyces venezuelae]QES51793.1 dipeptidyl aminopeptidase [Streptomyces venezuelae]